jgi:hypothetical protein
MFLLAATTCRAWMWSLPGRACQGHEGSIGAPQPPPQAVSVVTSLSSNCGEACTYQVARSTPVAAGQWGSNGTAHRTGPGKGLRASSASCSTTTHWQLSLYSPQPVIKSLWIHGRTLQPGAQAGMGVACGGSSARRGASGMHPGTSPSPSTPPSAESTTAMQSCVDWGGDIPGPLRCTKVPTWYISAAAGDNIGTLQPSPAMPSLVATTAMEVAGGP